LILAINGVPARYSQLVHTVDTRTLYALGFSRELYAGVIAGLDFVVILAHVLIAAIIFRSRRDEWIALFVSFTLITNGAITPLSLMYASEANSPVWLLLVDVVVYLGIVSSFVILYLFPDGRFIPPWTRLFALLWAIVNFYGIFFPNAPFSFPRWHILAQVIVLATWSGTGIFAQIYRYENVSRAVERQQTKWAILGLAGAVLGPFAYYLPFVIIGSLNPANTSNFLFQRLGSTFFTLSLLSRLGGLTVFTFALLIFPISFAIAILRYRLWDIDLIIRRTLIYSALTVVLAIIYFGSVILLQQVFRTLTGQQQSEIVTIVSTLAIAALFNPLRHRVQDAIDQRFFRRKYDAAQVLTAFAATCRDEVHLEKLSADLLAVVLETIQPAHVSLWLRTPGDSKK
jgi:hypothetical protein